MSQVDSSSAKKSTELTLIDRLSRLSYHQTLKLLGSDGPKLLRAGDSWDFRIEEDVCLSEDLFRLKFPLAPGETESPPVVTISLMDTSHGRLRWHCTVCESLCEHVGAAFSFILDEKMTLGLAAPPPERVPVESLSERELIERAIEERRERARTERMIVKSAEPEQPWTDYAVSNTISGKTYRVAVRGRELGDSYCSCPDFRTNTLGTCKHILHVLAKLKRRFTETELKRPYHRRTIGVHVQYRDQATLRLLLPERLDPEASEVLGKLRDRDIEDVPDLLKRIQYLERRGRTINIYPDAEEFIQRRLLQDRIARRVAEIRRQPESHPLRRELLKAELLPYQLDGIAFAAGAGRAVLADDMGLGKTIQAIGVSELLVREAGISKVLVICPASVKSQWRNEIRRFCDRDCQLIAGSIASRGAQYANNCFFTVCNYEQVLRDILSIERVNWDLIILDEGQRIKNWEAKPLDHAAGLRFPVLDALAFVENDEVPIHPFDREDVTQHLFVVAYGKEAVVGVLGASRGDAADDQLAIAVTEAPDFVPPLRFHRSGTDDEHLQYASLAHEQLRHPDGLDGFAKPHVIGKYRAAGAGGERDAVELIRQ